MAISLLLPIIIAGAGLYLLFRLKFFFVFHPIKCVRGFLSELRTPASRKALTLALAGTLGVGNIFGTAAAIMIGGAGSVFWLLFSSVFSMIIKYSEASLSLDMMDEGRGGMQYIILKVLGKRASFFATVYAALCLMMALFVGSTLQSAAVTDTMKITLGLNPAVCALALVFLLILTVTKGAERIEWISSKIIPAATLIYLILSIIVVIISANRLPTVFNEILLGAISPEAFGGGVLAFFASRALTEGFARGVMSNEAGIGTSAMAHTRSRKRPPEIAGLFGMSEIFFDTVLLCTVTGVVILCAVPNIGDYETPMALVIAAFQNSLGDISVYILAACMLLFGFSTIICWYYYGDECISFLIKRPGGAPFTFAYVFSLLIGALIDTTPLLFITDIIILLMALISITAVLRSTKRLELLTERLIK